MRIEDRFTEDELFLLTSTPSMIGSGMAFSAGSGLGTIKEMMANAKSLLAGISEYPDNAIIKGVLPNLEDRKEAMADAKAFREKAVARLKDKGITSHEGLRRQLLDDCRSVSALLAVKASPQEASEYKEWAMAVAENVAKAAKEGGFLGFGGERVSKEEKVLFQEIASALGTPSQLA